MLEFDLTSTPPTRDELTTEKNRLTHLKKQQLKLSIISDGCHCSLFLLLYLADLLSGYGLLLAGIAGTLLALMLAGEKRKGPHSLARPLLCASLSLLLVGFGCQQILQEPLTGALLAGALSASIVITGALIGGKFFHVFIGLENLRPALEAEAAIEEINRLCSLFPELADYRQQARDLLRPNLTLGELQAMRDWAAVKQQPS